MKKIMFNDKYGLTQAVLDGRKTQTRRIVPGSTLRKANLMVKVCGGSVEDKIIEQAPYCFSEEIAVAQSYSQMKVRETLSIQEKLNESFLLDKFEQSKGWGNKMFVEAKYMLHRIKITNIRVERLQDISEEDCLKEGIITSYDECNHRNIYGFPSGNKKVKLTPTWKADVGYLTPREAFAALIDKVSSKGTWESNPWVFVYDFELVK